MNNPLLSDYVIPPINEIKEEHFQPAMDEAVKIVRTKFESMRDNPDMPTFENTVVPFDTLFEEIRGIENIYALFYYNIGTPSLRSILAEINNKMDAVKSEVYQDAVMGERLKAVYSIKDSLKLGAEDMWLLERTKNAFEDRGALLDAAGQQRINEIDEELNRLTNKMDVNTETDQIKRSFLITDEAELDGVPESKKAAFRDEAEKKGHKTGWWFGLERLLVDELLELAENREFRKKIHETMDSVATEGAYDNTAMIKQVHALRDERAKLLGYKNFAEFKLRTTMAGSEENVRQLFDETVPSLVAAFEKDMETLQKWVDEKEGPQMEPWDVQYYAARYRAEVLGYDSQELAEYLDIKDVMPGWMAHVSKQLNVALKETSDYYIWDPAVVAYDVTDKSTGKKSVLFADLYARSGLKRGGAWKAEFQVEGTNPGKDVMQTMNLNLTKAAGDGPALVSPDQLLTYYHEGGHAGNELKGVAAKRFTGKGTGNGADYVEIHSMMSENWAFHPDVITTYAKHYKTREPLPLELLEKKEKAEKFMASRDVLRLVQNAQRDLNLHSMSASDFISDKDVEARSRLPSKFSDHVRPYPLTRFGHLFSEATGGYSSAYYGYFWAEVKGCQAFGLFEKNGVYDPASLRKLQNFFALGCAVAPNDAFNKSFDMKGLDVTPFLKKYGIEKISTNNLSPDPDSEVNNISFDI